MEKIFFNKTMMKNIRINKRIQSYSKQKEKKQQNSNNHICQQKQNSNSKLRLPKIEVSGEGKNSIQKQRDRKLSILGYKLQKNERKVLTLLNQPEKNKRLFSYNINQNSDTNIQSLNQTQKQVESMKDIVQKRIIFIHPNNEKNLPSFDLEVNNCSDNIQNITKNNYYQNYFQSIANQSESKKFRLNLQCVKGHWFSIQQSFSYSFNPFKQKENFATQTQLVENKGFYQYVKYLQLKTKEFNKIQLNQQHFAQIINETSSFKKNYQNLMAYLNESPENDRQKRVFALGQDLMKSEIEMKSIFKKVSLIKQQLRFDLNERFYPSTTKKQQILTSIKHLIKSIILKPFSNKEQQKKKTNRILQRILKQLEHFSLLNKNIQISQLKSFESYHKSIQTLESGYSNWSKLLLQNRVLIYNFMKQLSRIPETMISLFGYDNQLQNMLNWNDQKDLESRFNQYIGSKCDKCYQMKRKIRLLQFKNQQIKPIVKALEWLIRDKTQNRNCLQCI